MADPATTKGKNVVIPYESAEAVKQNLQQVAAELARVRDRAKEEADSLDRIRGMLDLKYLNDLLSTIETLEARVKQVEAEPQAKRYQKELQNEQQRLAKLWDAFKSQEDELKAVARERDEVLAELRKIEGGLAEYGGPGQARNRIITYDAENRKLKQDLNSYSERADRYAKQFAQEQERLAKLFKVYEDATARLARFEDEAAAWRKWLDKHASTLTPEAKNSAKRIKRAK